MKKQRCSSIQSESRAVDVSDQFRATTALPPGKELRYPLKRRVTWHHTVSWIGDKFLAPCRYSNPVSSKVRRVP
jgi:hypothetical protein